MKCSHCRMMRLDRVSVADKRNADLLKLAAETYLSGRVLALSPVDFGAICLLKNRFLLLNHEVGFCLHPQDHSGTSLLVKPFNVNSSQCDDPFQCNEAAAYLPMHRKKHQHEHID